MSSVKPPPLAKTAESARGPERAGSARDLTSSQSGPPSAELDAEVDALAAFLGEGGVGAPGLEAAGFQEGVEEIGELGLEPAAGVGADAAEEGGALQRLGREEVAVDLGEERGGGRVRQLSQASRSRSE